MLAQDVVPKQIRRRNVAVHRLDLPLRSITCVRTDTHVASHDPCDSVSDDIPPRRRRGGAREPVGEAASRKAIGQCRPFGFADPKNRSLQVARSDNHLEIGQSSIPRDHLRDRPVRLLGAAGSLRSVIDGDAFFTRTAASIVHRNVDAVGVHLLADIRAAEDEPVVDTSSTLFLSHPRVVYADTSQTFVVPVRKVTRTDKNALAIVACVSRKRAHGPLVYENIAKVVR